MSVVMTGKTDKLDCKRNCQDLNIKSVFLLIYKEFVTISKFKMSKVIKTQTSLSIQTLYLTNWPRFGKRQKHPSILVRLQ